MKEIVLGVVLMSSLLLSACSSGESSSSTSLEKTVASLKTENSKLKNGQGINSLEESSNSDSSDSSEEATKKELIKSLNDPVTYTTDGKDVLSLKITKASTNQNAFPDHMISFDEYDTKNMIAVTFEFKNIDLDSEYGLNSSELTAFDATGKAYENVNQQIGQDYVNKGRSSQSTLFWNVPNAESVNELELDYQPSPLYDAPVTTFKIPVEH